MEGVRGGDVDGVDGGVVQQVVEVRGGAGVDAACVRALAAPLVGKGAGAMQVAAVDACERGAADARDGIGKLVRDRARADDGPAEIGHVVWWVRGWGIA